jgi:hypothetical protein
MEHRFHFVRLSGNKKLGGLPATSSSRSTCPDNCSFKGNGCYGDSGPIHWHWRAIPNKGTDLDTHCKQIRDLPKHQMFRLWQVGDFPGQAGKLDGLAMHKLVSANRGKHGFGFTHYSPLDQDNADCIEYANNNGLTINLSAESLKEADTYAELGIGPVVVAMPEDAANCKTPGGRDVMLCPASVNPKMTCAKCGLCAVPTRKSVIGFPAHGAGKAKVNKVFWAKSA